MSNHFNKSVLAISLTLALAACSDSSGPSTSPSGPSNSDGGEITTPERATSRFIDSAVEGLVYRTSTGVTGITNSAGEYSSEEGDTVTFYLGGTNGVKLGAASDKAVLTPFETSGKYDRSINVAILLQSIDAHFGSSGDDVLTIPAQFQSLDDEIVRDALQNLSLSEHSSVVTFLNEIGVTDVVSEEEALAHMQNSLADIHSSLTGEASQFAQGSGNIIKNLYVPIREITSGDTFVHADTTLPGDAADQIVGLGGMVFKLNQDNIEVLINNDRSISGDYAKTFVNCIAEGYDFSFDNYTCSSTPSNDFQVASGFSYNFNQPSDSPEGPYSYDEKWLPVGTTNIADLHSFEDVTYDDSNDNDGTGWQRVITSSSYDPETAIFTQIRKKIEYTSDSRNCDVSDTCTTDYIFEYVDFYYQVPSQNEERYIDFTGTWETTSICNDGSVATATTTFGATGGTFAGQECQNNTATTLNPETYDYAFLASIDYWWFGQPGRESKATLAELNSTVKFCDQDNFDNKVDTCQTNDEQYVKWEYQPAGANWDKGLLIRKKYNSDGSLSSFSTTQKM